MSTFFVLAAAVTPDPASADCFPQEALGFVPRPVEWLRYSGFIVLYPIGVASELTMVYRGLPYMKDNHMYDMLMPNTWNFGFSYYTFLVIGTLLYIPGFPKVSKSF